MLDEAPDDVEEVVATWLNTLLPCAISRKNDDPLPFVIVRHIAGKEDQNCGTADLIVSVRTLSDKKLGEDVAAAHSRDVHRQMLEFARYLPDIFLASSGQNASVDYVSVNQSPRWMKYENDAVLCKESKYAVGLSYSPI